MENQEEDNKISYWKLISLSTYALKESIIKVSNNSSFEIDLEEDFEFYRQNNKSIKTLPKREQYKILDLIKQSEKKEKEEKKLFEKKIILLDSSLFALSNYQDLLEILKKNFDFEIQSFSSLEQSRQSFLGLQAVLSGYSSEQTKILFINIETNKTLITSGDLLKKEQSISLEIGKKQVTKYISSLVKENKVNYLPTFIKASLYKFIQQIKVLGKPSLVCFSENSIGLLEQIFSSNSNSFSRQNQTKTNAKEPQKTQRIDTDSIYQFCNRLISSNFRPTVNKDLNSLNFDNSEDIYNNSGHLILIGFLLQLLGVKNCLLNKQARIIGYVTNELNKTKNLNIEEIYQTDWFSSAQELALRFSPEKISQASQSATLAYKFFNSSFGILHKWGSLEKKHLWLSAFFFELTSRMSPKILEEIFFEYLEDLSQTESKIIRTIISLVGIDNFASRIDILSTLPVDKRECVSKLAYIVELARAFDITGRSAVQDLWLENKNETQTDPILKITPRLDLSPELIQVGLLKNTFENQFDKKIKIELV